MSKRFGQACLYRVQMLLARRPIAPKLHLAAPATPRLLGTSDPLLAAADAARTR